MRFLEPFLERFFQTTFFFRLVSLTWLEILDLFLVALAFYMLLSFVRQTRAAFLVQGVLFLTSVLFIVSIVLPLPAFDWLVRGALIAVLVAIPIIFQTELRRLLERIGRAIGLAWDGRQTATEQVLPGLVRAVENMSASRTGALIVLEGHTSLQDIIETGVSIGGQITSELLQAIFYPSNPLHDGAVIVRDEKVVAASCVLPLTERPLQTHQRRLGTRHRAAVGLSEHSDALIIVVSEETGQISAAHNQVLPRPLDNATLRKHLLDFYTPSASSRRELSWRELIRQTVRRFWQQKPLLTPDRLPSSASFLVISILLAWATWTFVMQQTNPARVDRFDIPLQTGAPPSNVKLVDPPPDMVSVVFRTTDRVRPTLSSQSFQANISLAELSPGLHRLDVHVIPSVRQVQVLSVDPPAVDVELAPVITQTMDVTVELADQQNLSRAYQVVGEPTTTPQQVSVTGAQPVVNRVSQIQATISLANASTSLTERVPVRALDELGREVDGVTVKPAQVQAHVRIQRRQDARDVGVRVVTTGAPATGYWVRALNVTPANVTLQGDPAQLSRLNSFVNTMPVDISNAAGNVSSQVPLDLPPNVQAIDSMGNTANTVSVQIDVAPRNSSVFLMRPVELIGLTSPVTTTVVPAEVELILSGPAPTLDSIEANPDLIQVFIDASNLPTGQKTELAPTVTAPDDVNIRLVPPSVSITIGAVAEK
jgi:diadenylate cyclase